MKVALEKMVYVSPVADWTTMSSPCMLSGSTEGSLENFDPAYEFDM